MDTSSKELSPDLVEKARAELSEIPEQVPAQIQELRETIQKDPKLNFRTDDAFLLRFLRARKFNQKRTFELIKNYYKQRVNYPTLYGKLSTSAIPEVLSSKFHGFLADRDRFGRPILVCNSYSYWDPSKFSLEDIAANFLLNQELVIEEDEVQIRGIVCIVDARGLGLHHFPQLTLRAVQQFLRVTQDAFPVRYKETHIVNQHPLFNILYAFCKPFLSSKFKRRIFFHGSNLKELHARIGPEILPEEFGGLKGPYDNSRWNQLLAEHDEILSRDLAYGFVP